jgi:hypothetical protein
MYFLVCPNFDLLTQLIGPYALGVLPKANFFAELVHSMDDNPMKPNGSTTKSVRAVATSHPKNSYKGQESGMALNHQYSFIMHWKCLLGLSTLYQQ